MKKILIILLSVFTFYACSDDNKLSTEDKKQEIFEALIGKWQFSRAANDAKLTQLVNIEIDECNKKNYIEFFNDNKCESRLCCLLCSENKKIQIEEGTFEVGIHKNIPYLDISGGAGISITDMIGFMGCLDIYHYDKNTLVLYNLHIPDFSYMELKRIE